MRFGSCQQCGSYKYLRERGQCPTCLDDNVEDCSSVLVAEQCDRCSKLSMDCEHDNASNTKICLNTLESTEDCTCNGFESASIDITTLLDEARDTLD